MATFGITVPNGWNSCHLSFDLDVKQGSCEFRGSGVGIIRADIDRVRLGLLIDGLNSIKDEWDRAVFERDRTDGD